MSWIRTCLSLFTFGFSIAQFFQYLAPQQDGNRTLASPHQLGLALIGVGILALVLAIVEHVQRIRNMKRRGLPADASSVLPIGSAVGLLGIGVAALITVAMRWSL